MKKLVVAAEQEAAIRGAMEARCPAEYGVFCLVFEHSLGIVHIKEIITPPPNAWAAQGEHHLTPTTQWLSAVGSQAQADSLGLMFLHSHPNALHPPSLSRIDRQTSVELAQTLGAIVDGPFMSGVIHQSGWNVEYWDGNELKTIPKIIKIGKKIALLNVSVHEATDLDSRQQSALGDVNYMLKQLEVAIVGCGGIGSQVAVQLARMGIGKLVLIDNDVIDTASNVRRMSGTKLSDFVPESPKSKVEVVGDYIESLGLGVNVVRLRADVRLPDTQKELEPADVIMACTDNHSSRAALNYLPFTHQIPVIDVGTRVSSKMNGELAGLWTELRVITPASTCLNCRGVIDHAQVAEENLPDDLREQAIKDGYVTGEASHGPEPSVLALTSYAASHAITALVGLLSEAVSPDWYRVEALTAEFMDMGQATPDSECVCA